VVVDTATEGQTIEEKQDKARASQIAMEGEQPEDMEIEDGGVEEISEGSLVIIGDQLRRDTRPNICIKTKIKMNMEKDCTALDQGDDNDSHMSTSQIGIALLRDSLLLVNHK
jgi:hypothetical protein